MSVPLNLSDRLYLFYISPVSEPHSPYSDNNIRVPLHDCGGSWTALQDQHSTSSQIYLQAAHPVQQQNSKYFPFNFPAHIVSRERDLLQICSLISSSLNPHSPVQVETNVCVTTNTYSELETTVCSSDGAWQRRNNKSLDHYETITNSSIGSSLKPINTLVNRGGGLYRVQS